MAKAVELNNSNGKREALEAARLQIDKEFGKGSLMKLGDNKDILDVETIPSGSLLLDEALGVGGYPKGRIIEIYGPESSGKTTLALHAVAEAQKQGGPSGQLSTGSQRVTKKSWSFWEPMALRRTTAPNILDASKKFIKKMVLCAWIFSSMQIVSEKEICIQISAEECNTQGKAWALPTLSFVSHSVWDYAVV